MTDEIVELGGKIDAKEIHRVLHKMGNTVCVHEKQLHLIEEGNKVRDKRISHLEEHSQNQTIKLTIVENKQDYSIEAIKEVTSELKNIGKEIGIIKSAFSKGKIWIAAISSIIPICCLFVGYMIYAVGTPLIFLLKSYLDNLGTQH